MSGWEGFTPLAPVCPDCGAHLPPWNGALELDWRDDAERARGAAAVAIQTHRWAKHRVMPQVGDLIRYSTPWRGHILTSDVYRVDAILRDEGAAYDRMVLVNPRKSNDRCFPRLGDARCPITIQIVEEAPPVQTDLLDLLDGWSAA